MVSKSLFGSLADTYLSNIDRLLSVCARPQYEFVENDEFKSICHSNLSEGMKIFWTEMLARAHLTSITAMFRNKRWIAGISSAVRDKNLLAFASSFRGLIESAADTHTALNAVPGTLARDHARINQCLEGKATKPFVVKSLEEFFIHYLYARQLKKNEPVPESHRSRKIRDYIQILENGRVDHVVECYSRLCDLTHPGASSVWMFIKPLNENKLLISDNQDEHIISRFLSEYASTYLELFMFAFNGPVLTLAVLNYLKAPQFHTPILQEWDLSEISLWRKVFQNLADIPIQVKGVQSRNFTSH